MRKPSVTWQVSIAIFDYYWDLQGNLATNRYAQWLNVVGPDGSDLASEPTNRTQGDLVITFGTSIYHYISQYIRMYHIYHDS